MSRKEDRLMSIGEIAKSLGITRRIILNYEEKNLLQASRHITTELLIWSL